MANDTNNVLNIDTTELIDDDIKECEIRISKEEYDRILRENNRLKYQLKSLNTTKQTLDRANETILQLQCKNEELTQQIQRLNEQHVKCVNHVNDEEREEMILPTDSTESTDDTEFDFLDEIMSLLKQNPVDEYKNALIGTSISSIYAKVSDENKATPLALLADIYGEDLSDIQQLDLLQQYKYLLSETNAKISVFKRYHLDRRLSIKMDIRQWSTKEIKLSFIHHAMSQCTGNDVTQQGQIWHFGCYLWRHIDTAIGLKQYFSSLAHLKQIRPSYHSWPVGVQIFVSVCTKFGLKMGQYIMAKKICRRWGDILNVQLNGVGIPSSLSDLKLNAPFRCMRTRGCDDEKMVFIPKKGGTEDAIKMQFIYEDFVNKEELFHYLDWTIKMNQISLLFKRFASIANGRELIVFNMEISTRISQSVIYCIAVNNDNYDVNKPRSQKYKCIGLMTQIQIQRLLQINKHQLPIGPRLGRSCALFIGYSVRIGGFTGSVAMLSDLEIISIFKQYYDRSQYINNALSLLVHLRIIRPKNTTNNRNELVITTQKLYECINEGMNKYALIPITSFNKKKTIFYDDVLLPIQIENGQYIAIQFQDGNPKAILFDVNDICTKAMAFNPLFDKTQIKWLQNQYTNIRHQNKSEKHQKQ